MVSRSDGRRNIALPRTRHAPKARARSRRVRSDICMPADWSFATAAAGDMASSRIVISNLPGIHRHALPDLPNEVSGGDLGILQSRGLERKIMRLDLDDIYSVP